MHRSICCAVGLLSLAVAAPFTPSPTPSPAPSGTAVGPTVTIASGVIQGTTSSFPSSTAVNKFLGIPFAQSPPQRFAPPADPAKWSAPLDATKFKPACIQQFSYPQSQRDFVMKIFNNPNGPPPLEDEDCLYLNVYAPTGDPPAGGFPVMFWLFGGNLQFGTAGIPYYDGSTLAAHQNVVVVTTNYRTNAFGFPNSPEIQEDAQNIGFLDQRKALDWVTTNIGAFGGDPTKVTLFGESAGGYSVKQLMAVPPSPLPFRAAIMESEATSFSGKGVDAWNALVNGTNCTGASSQLECVRKADATQIKSVAEHGSLSFSPVFDGKTCIKDVRDPIKAKTWANVPFMIGTNANEGRVFATAAGLTPDVGKDAAEAWLAKTFPSHPELVKAILAAYPTWLTRNAYEFVSQVITDYIFTCRASAIAGRAADQGFPAYRYVYNGSFPNLALFADAGAYHSSEIPLVFGTYPVANATRDEALLSLAMQKAWATLATSPSQGPGWPRIGSADGQELQELGANGTGQTQTIPLHQVDWVCNIYDPIIFFQGL